MLFQGSGQSKSGENSILQLSEEQQASNVLSSQSIDYVNATTSSRSSRSSVKQHSNEISSIEMLHLKATSPSNNEINNSSTNQSKKLKVRTQKSFMVLALIVILFLITHCYRMALKIYEVALPELNTIERFQICFTQNR